MTTQRDCQNNKDDNKETTKKMKRNRTWKNCLIVAAGIVTAVAMVAGLVALIYSGNFQVIAMSIAALFS